MGILHRVSQKRNVSIVLLLALVAGLAGWVSAASPIVGELYDFGFVPVDFKICHDYVYINKSAKPVTIRTHVVPCDCSTVRIGDSLIAPGDSTLIRLEFDTGNLFGPTSKSFTVSTTDPATPLIEYQYTCNVGQWPFGLRPDPLSAFFLPGAREKKIVIPNRVLGSLEMSIADQADTLYRVELLQPKATKGQAIEIQVMPVSVVKAGTYLSSFRLRVAPPEGKPPLYLSIPVKIVRY